MSTEKKRKIRCLVALGIDPSLQRVGTDHTFDSVSKHRVFLYVFWSGLGQTP